MQYQASSAFASRFRAALASVSQRREQTARTLKGRKTVLVVESDPRVRVVVKRLLEAQGHLVIAVRNREHASRAIECWDGALDLVLIDIRQSEAAAFDLARQMKAVSASTAVVFMTADYDEELPDGFNDMQLLRKPFSAEQLARAVG